ARYPWGRFLPNAVSLVIQPSFRSRFQNIRQRSASPLFPIRSTALPERRSSAPRPPTACPPPVQYSFPSPHAGSPPICISTASNGMRSSGVSSSHYEMSRPQKSPFVVPESNPWLQEDELFAATFPVPKPSSRHLGDEPSRQGSRQKPSDESGPRRANSPRHGPAGGPYPSVHG